MTDSQRVHYFQSISERKRRIPRARHCNVMINRVSHYLQQIHFFRWWLLDVVGSYPRTSRGTLTSLYAEYITYFCFNTNELWHKYTRKYWFSAVICKPLASLFRCKHSSNALNRFFAQVQIVCKSVWYSQHVWIIRWRITRSGEKNGKIMAAVFRKKCI